MALWVEFSSIFAVKVPYSSYLIYLLAAASLTHLTSFLSVPVTSSANEFHRVLPTAVLSRPAAH